MPIEEIPMMKALDGFVSTAEKVGVISSITLDAIENASKQTISFLDSEVNHRPAAQEWTVCTP